MITHVRSYIYKHSITDILNHDHRRSVALAYGSITT